MNTDYPALSRVALTLLPRLNSFACLPLFEKCGGIEGFFNESKPAIDALCRDTHIKPETINREKALEAARKEMEDITRNGIHICSSDHQHFPPLLANCEDAPLVFYYKGTLQANNVPSLAVVGTRKASERCKARIDGLIQELSGIAPTLAIVSGLAYGIDITAHNACLKYGLKTYAVLGHGLNTLYPAPHKNTSERILAEGGALISEFPCCAETHPGNFLQRNRIIAGLCSATLVGESGVKGGSMATARIAMSYNRDVMAIPGRPEDKMSEGCNLLIKQNIATLTESAKDVAGILNLKISKQPNLQMTLDLFGEDDQEALAIKALTEHSTTNIDELSTYTRIPVYELAAILLKLELQGSVTSLPGKNYMLN